MTQSIYPSLAYDDAPGAIEWLSAAFGFVPGLVVPGDDGQIAHAEVRTATDGLVMIISTGQSTRRDRNPRRLGGTAHSVYVTAVDVDALHDRAVAAGAEVFNPLHTTDYGTREFCCLDPEGHIWTFGTYNPAV
ncbi:MAG: VOC family protein [Acidimicrobiales bacterium]